MRNIRGISLIALIITVIVIIILAGAVILSLANNNPIETANKAKFISDIDTFQSDLDLYKVKQYADKVGQYNPALLNADKSTATYNEVKITQDATISTIIASMKGDYLNKFEIKNGILVLISGTENEKTWAEEKGIVVYGGVPKVTLSADKDRVAPGTDVKYTLNFVTVEENNTINLEENIKLVNSLGQELSNTILSITQIGQTATVTVKTDSLTNGTYTLKVLEGMITSETGLKNQAKELSFDIDTSKPENPLITIVSPNPLQPAQQVTIGIDYYTATVKLYAVTANKDTVPQDSQYAPYTGQFVLQENSVVWAKSKNELGTSNETVSTLEITIIDRAEPQEAVIVPTTSGSTINSTVTLADTESEIDLTQSKYVITTSTDTPDWSTATSISSNPFTISQTKTDGDYYLHILSVDRAGNRKASVSSKITVVSKTVTQIYAGFIGTAYAIYSDGTVKAWGSNSYGQVGIGSIQDTKILLPTPVIGLIDGVKQIASGNGHTLLLLNNGTVMAVGRNDYGQLGDNTIVDKYTPVLVSNLSNVKQVGAGEIGSVALLNDGTVKTWGYNGDGTLGDGTTVDKHIPTSVPGLTGVQQISMATFHILALMQDGTLKGWGDNSYGQLGNGGQSDVRAPSTLTNYSNNIKEVTATNRGSFVIYNTGVVKACGDNNKYEVGDGTTTWRATPITVTGFTDVVKHILYGYTNNSALLNNGTVMAWGTNGSGIMGDGTTTAKTRPTLLPNISGVVQLALASNTTYVLLNDGTVKAFGSGAYGQLGNGTTTNSTTWVTVQNLLT